MLRLGAEDLLEFEIIDEVIAEPLGGAHRDPEDAARRLKEALVRHLHELMRYDGPALVEAAAGQVPPHGTAGRAHRGADRGRGGHG